MTVVIGCKNCQSLEHKRIFLSFFCLPINQGIWSRFFWMLFVFFSTYMPKLKSYEIERNSFLVLASIGCHVQSNKICQLVSHSIFHALVNYVLSIFKRLLMIDLFRRWNSWWEIYITTLCNFIIKFSCLSIYPHWK